MRNGNLTRACTWMAAAGMAFASTAGARAGEGGGDNRILFIGNSVTSSNDMPVMVGQIRDLAGPAPSDYYQQSATTFGEGLDYHWSDFSPDGARQKLDLGGWDGVVLQDLSVDPTDAPNRLRTYVRLFDAEIKVRAPLANTYLFAHWERQDRPNSQPIIDSVYGGLGQELDATVAPVGRVWKQVEQLRPDMQLYADVIHPTARGSYLAAAVFYATIYGRSPEGTPPPTGIPSADAALIQSVAWDVVSGRQSAQDRSWVNSNAQGDWNDASAWNSQSVPAAGDRVMLAQGDSAARVVNYLNPIGASTLLGSLTISASNGSMTLQHSQSTLRLAGNLVLGDTSGGVGHYELSNTGKLFEARDERLIAGSFVQHGGKHTVMGKMTIAGEPGQSAAYLLDGGTLQASALDLKFGGTFTQNGGMLEVGTFNLMGGTVTGTLENHGWINFSSGNFAGKLLNEGTTLLGADPGKIATADVVAAHQMDIEVGGDDASVVVANANQDLRSLVVRYDNPGRQGFDLASGSGAGQFRSIRIYPGDETALTQQERDLRWAIAHALQGSQDGIYDSTTQGRAQVRLGMARRVDLHGDNFILLRPTVIGDLNLDGNVSIADFIDLARHYGQPESTWEQGDINYDGSVTIADFIELAAHFGSSYSGDAIPISPDDQQLLRAFAAANVPEPGSLFLLGVAAAVMGLARRWASRSASAAPAAG